MTPIIILPIRIAKLIAKKAYHKLRRYKAKYKNVIATEYLSIAQSMINKSRYLQASKLLGNTIVKYKNSAPKDMYLKLAMCYEKLELPNMQASTLKLAVDQYPDEISVYLAYIEFLISKGHYNEFVLMWSATPKALDPKLRTKFWQKFSRHYINVGRPDLAEKILKDGLVGNEANKGLQIELAEVYSQQGKYSEALTCLDETLVDFKDNPNIGPTSDIIKARYIESVCSRMLNTDKYKKAIDYYNRYKNHQNKIAVYTCITGNYDPMQLHEVLNPKFDYYIFTDQSIYNVGIYNVKTIPFHQDDPVRAARYVKTHPHTLLPEYDTVIWVDANVIITGDLEKYINDLSVSRKFIGAIPHPQRLTLQEEAQACIDLGKDDPATIKQQVRLYERSDYSGTDTIESGFLVYSFKRRIEISKFLDRWWEQIDSFSRRDQLSFGYALHNSKLSWHALMNKPNNIRNNPDFILVPHGSIERYSDELAKKISNGKLTMPLITKPPIKVTQIKSVDIIVCVHNALNEVRQCLESIVRHKSKKYKTNLIIIDDGSQNVTARYLKDFSRNKDWVKVYRNKLAKGYTKAANLGLKNSRSDFVILVNSDAIVTKNWTDKMVQVAQAYPKIGIVGPMSSAASHQSIPNDESSNNQTAVNNLPNGVTIEDMNRYCEKWSKDIQFPMVPLVHGFCFGVTRQLINTIGVFDDNNFPKGYGEENDYCFRATNAGFGMMIALNTYIYHSKSKSYSNNDIRINLMNDGSKKLTELYGGERIKRAILTMKSNPAMKKIREMADELY